MKFVIGPEIVNSYKRLSYTEWYALAEFIDNSTQAYFNNKKLLDSLFKINNEQLNIIIEQNTDKNGSFIKITDNSIGMSSSDLKDAIIVGRPPVNTKGRSKYGIGLKTAACWFGNYWIITTKKYDDDFEISIIIDVDKIANNNVVLKLKKKKVDKKLHYTIITIYQLNRKLQPRTIGKIKNYLRSFYRIDLNKYKLNLSCFGEKLKWDPEAIDNRLIKYTDGSLAKENFEFLVNGKKVHGWAGVFARGSRSDAGFSIIQAERVIKGWPNSFKPELLYGSQEGGVNDLVNQRLVGELYLDGFDVSHTKDEILFVDEELEELENSLFEKIGNLKQLALSYRKPEPDDRDNIKTRSDVALNELEEELNSNKIKDFMETYEIPPAKLIKNINTTIIENIETKIKPSLTAEINELKILIYMGYDMSPNDPYVLIESTKFKSKVIVIINMNHPHWLTLKSSDSILNFIRHCVYDGVAEWKTYFKLGKIEPDTVKLIKDNLLRLPFNMDNTDN